MTKIHELKLDPLYFDDVKSGRKNFEIRKDDRGFEVGDVLELKKYHKKAGYLREIEIIKPSSHFEMGKGQKPCTAKQADTITAKVVEVISADEFNTVTDQWLFDANYYGWSVGRDYIEKILNDYFGTDELSEGYVVLEIEVIN